MPTHHLLTLNFRKKATKHQWIWVKCLSSYHLEKSLLYQMFTIVAVHCIINQGIFLPYFMLWLKLRILVFYRIW